MWNEEKLKNNLHLFNLVLHPLRGKKVLYNDQQFEITAVFKEWKSGWFYSIELENSETCRNYIRIPFLNINSEDTEIIEQIETNDKLIKIEEDKS